MMGLADTLKVQPDQLSERVARMVAQLKEAEREIASLKSANLLAGSGAIAAKSKDMWGIDYIAHRADGVGRQRPAGSGRRRCATGSPTRPPWSAVIGGTAGQAGRRDRDHRGRPAPRRQGRRAGHASPAEALGGRGGGKDDLAQGGGTDAHRRRPGPHRRRVRHRRHRHPVTARPASAPGVAAGAGLGSGAHRRGRLRPGRHARLSRSRRCRPDRARSRGSWPWWPSTSRSSWSSGCRARCPAVRDRRRATGPDPGRRAGVRGRPAAGPAGRRAADHGHRGPAPAGGRTVGEEAAVAGSTPRRPRRSWNTRWTANVTRGMRLASYYRSRTRPTDPKRLHPGADGAQVGLGRPGEQETDA